MAQKRMFDKRVISSDNFLEMPLSTQAVYFHLNMRADDDGFVDNWKSILRLIGGKEDDLKVLLSKKFIIPFESGVIVIKHWKMNNLLRKDRYIETIYQEEKGKLTEEESGEYSLGIPNGNQVATQYSIVENSIVKNSIYIPSNKKNALPQNDAKCDSKCDANSELFTSFWKAYPKKRDKGKTEKWFEKNNPSKELVETMIKQINRFKDTEEWQNANGQFIPYPTTWLNGKMWEDEFETKTEKDERMEREMEDGI